MTLEGVRAAEGARFAIASSIYAPPVDLSEIPVRGRGFCKNRLPLRNRTVRDLVNWAINRGDLSIELQPIRDIQSSPTEEATYFEILLRVQEMSPIDFLERLSFSEEWRSLDRWVIEQVAALPESSRYAINLSPYSLDGDLINTLLATDRRVTIEITERHLIEITQSKTLVKLCQRFPVVLDDFAEAYSGLNRLVEFNFHGIKIDGLLVRQIGVNPKARAIVSNILRMAQDLEICCVCEFVESLELWRQLQILHTEYAPKLKLYVQGWAVGMPSAIGKWAAIA